MICVGLLVNAYSRHSIHGEGRTVQAHKPKGVSTHDARGWFYNLTKWDHGGGDVRAGSHMVPSRNSLEVNPCNLNC